MHDTIKQVLHMGIVIAVLAAVIIGIVTFFPTADAFQTVWDGNLNQGIHYNFNPEQQTGSHTASSDRENLHVVDFDKFRDFINDLYQSNIFVGDDSTSIDDSAQGKFLLDGSLFVASQDVAVITDDKYKEICCDEEPPKERAPQLGKDENCAGHMCGMGYKDGFTFLNLETPDWGASTTEIHFYNGQATDRYVYVFYEGYYLGKLDIGRQPTGELRDETIGVTGQIFKLPFGLYHTVTKEGQLLHHGEGYQHVSYDLNGLKSFHDAENEDIIAYDLSQYSYAKEMQKASWLRK